MAPSFLQRLITVHTVECLDVLGLAVASPRLLLTGIVSLRFPWGERHGGGGHGGGCAAEGAKETAAVHCRLLLFLHLPSSLCVDAIRSRAWSRLHGKAFGFD